MANYVSSVSDFPKSRVLKAWLLGVFGTLGIQYFAVYRIKAGLGRLLLGIFIWLMSIVSMVTEEIASGEAGWLMTVTMFAILFIPAVIDLVKILLGTFKDNVGNVVRAK